MTEAPTARASALVSIIIPCWNGEHHVADAIESALAQTYPRIEVIVIDDGSTDGSVDVLRSFGDRIRWESGPNRGACAARNRGAELAAGAFFQFLDADDILLPRKIERTLAAAGEADVTPVCGWESVGEDGAVRVHLPGAIGPDGFAYALAHQIQTATPLHERHWYLRVGGFLPGLPCGQERDLHIRLAAAGLSFAALNEPLVRVRRRRGSVSSNAHRVLLQHEGTFMRAHQILRARGALTDTRKAALARAFLRDARLLVRIGDRAAARRYAACARTMHEKGGLDAFERKSSRLLAEIAGPVTAERIIQFVVRSLASIRAAAGAPSRTNTVQGPSRPNGDGCAPMSPASNAVKGAPLDQTVE